MKGVAGSPQADGGASDHDRSVEHLQVVRRARVVVEGPRSGPVAELWILLHGYRQLASRFLRHARILRSPDRLLVAPEGLSRFYLEGTPGPHRGGDPVGSSWMTREDREAEIADYVDYLDGVLDWAMARVRGSSGDAVPRVRVLGFSQGVHTAARWIALGRAFRVGGPAFEREPAVVLWGTPLPRDLPDQAEERFRALGDLVRVRGEVDELRDERDEAAEDELLRRWSVSSRVFEHAGGHRIDGALLLQLAETLAAGP